MLPFNERRIGASLNTYIPLEKRGVAVPDEPKTIGEHLRKRRHELGLFQSQVIKKLGVSQRTLSLWEWDKVYPAWAYQSRLIEYLGCDPFDNPALGRPLGNETQSVAVLSSHEPLTLLQQLHKRRLELRKNRKECAKYLGVSVKTLRDWETGRREPTVLNRKRIEEFCNAQHQRK